MNWPFQDDLTEASLTHTGGRAIPAVLRSGLRCGSCSGFGRINRMNKLTELRGGDAVDGVMLEPKRETCLWAANEIERLMRIVRRLSELRCESCSGSLGGSTMHEHEIEIKVDAADYSAIQCAIAMRQTWMTMSDGEGNVAGRVLAEICRGWLEHREKAGN